MAKPTNYAGQLNSNEIFTSIFNMIISQRVFADNIKGTNSDLAEKCRVDGSLYGDTKLYYSTDVLKSAEWGKDLEAANLLNLYRPEDPECQAISIDQFRQICLTVDQYLSKRSWSTEGAFSDFNSVMLGWIGNTKKIYDSLLVNTFIGTNETTEGEQSKLCVLPENADAEVENRLQAQTLAKFLADLLLNMKDITRDYNDYGNLRSYAMEDLRIVWNGAYKNQITIMDLPTIFHKDGLFGELEEVVLPQRYFGTVNTAGATLGNTNASVRSLIETDYTVSGKVKHVMPGDLLPGGATYLANTTYTEDTTVAFKIMHKDAVPYMSAFEVATSFFNPKSLTETHYLTFGYNKLEHLHNYPFITVKAKVASEAKK